MRRISLYTAAVLCLFAFSSCTDWLDIRPRTEVPEKDLFDTEQGFQDALTSCYIKLNSTNLYSQNLTYRGIEFLAQHWSTSSEEVTAFKKFQYLGAVDAENTYLESFRNNVYLEQYNVISQANTILQNLPEKGSNIADEGKRKLIEAEALALRAFCHFEVLRLFGQVPQNATIKVDLPYAKTVGISNIPKKSFDDFISEIFTDLNRAEELFKQSDPLLKPSQNISDVMARFDEANTDDFLSYRRFRFNVHAVTALKARVYMYTGNKSEAYSYAKQTIGDVKANGMELAGDVDFDKSNYCLPSESILALSNFRLGTIVQFQFWYNSLYLANARLNTLFPTWMRAANNRYVRVWDRDHKNSQGTVYPIVRKYKQPSSEEVSDILELALYKQVIPLIRLSEMYLIMLEAATSLSEANQIFRTYMQARNIILTNDQFNDLSEVPAMVTEEYRREFFAEGQMFYYYKRTGATSMLWTSPTSLQIQEVNYVVPVPITDR